MLLTALLIIGPAVLVMLGLGELYIHFGSSAQVQLVLLEIDAVVVGIVGQAAVETPRRPERRARLLDFPGCPLSLDLLDQCDRSGQRRARLQRKGAGLAHHG
jgi:hypothetical protein